MNKRQAKREVFRALSEITLHNMDGDAWIEEVAETEEDVTRINEAIMDISIEFQRRAGCFK